MYDKVIFYCHYGSGDIHESREFVKEYMRRIPANEYLYAHGRADYILEDFIKRTDVTDIMDMRKAWFVDNNILYINTWIGRDSQYVLPQVGCVLEQFYRMHNDILYSMEMSALEKDMYEYIPKLDFDLMFGKVAQKVRDANSSTKKVLICNPQVHSNQAANFDFTPVIERLCNTYPKVDFAVTENVNLEFKNLVSLQSFNHNKVAFVSTFCDIIVGRKSGSHTFCQHLENWLDPKKTCISFTYAKHSGHFVLSNHLPMKKVWSGATDPEEVFKVIVKEIEDVN
jgi:hypothetical protein